MSFFTRTASLLANLLGLSLLSAASPATPPLATSDKVSAEIATQQKPDPAAENFWTALKLLRSTKADDLAAGRTALQTASDMEFSHAQVLLGNCLLTGSYGFTKDASKGANLFRLAAGRGNAFAKVSLGQCLFTGTGTSKDMVKAAEWLTSALAPEADYTRPVPSSDFFAANSAASAGTIAGEQEHDPVSESQATAHYLLGQISDEQKQSVAAQMHYVAAATAGTGGRDGIYQAALQAALNYAFGNGTPRDLNKAHEMLSHSRKLASRMSVSLIHNYAELKIVDEFATADLEESAAKANAAYESELQIKIATTFADRKSPEYNPTEAVKWYELAAESDQVWAMLSLAFLYSGKELGPPDFKKAFYWFEKAGGGESPKHYLAAANFGICLQNGLGTPPDKKRAMALFKKLRDYDFVCYLGSIGQCPVQVVTFEEALQLNQDWAQKNNDPQAQYLLAQRYQYAWGVTSDLPQAVILLKKAAEQNNGNALFALGLLYENQRSLFKIDDPDEARALAATQYRAASRTGHIEAMINYASMVADSDLAEKICLRCLQLDSKHARAHNNLAVIYKNRLLKELNPNRTRLLTDTPASAEVIADWTSKMLSHFETSAELHCPDAVANLADLYLLGKLVPQDSHRVINYLEQLVDDPAHRKEAHFQLGLMHEKGDGIPVTYTEAAYHYRLAALDGHVEALGRLINFYISGHGVSRDLDRAAFWLQYMAQLGQPHALITLSDIMLGKKEYAQAVGLLNELVERYSTDTGICGYAHERLSLCYDKGYGVEPNPIQATKHLNLAIKMGNANALATYAKQQIAEGNFANGLALYQRAAEYSVIAAYELGQIYFFGTHTEKNRSAAIKYMNFSAKRNHPDALFFLANLAWENDPDAPSLDEAIRFAQQAENLGLSKAAELREKLEQRSKAGSEKIEDTAKARSS